MKWPNKDYNKGFYIALTLLTITLLFSAWLLRQEGPWDLFVFIFITLPVNIILLLILIFMKKY